MIPVYVHTNSRVGWDCGKHRLFFRKRIGGGRALSSAESEDSAGSESSDISVGDEGVGHVWSDWDVSAESKVRPEGEPSVTFFAVERLEVRGLLSSPRRTQVVKTGQ